MMKRIEFIYLLTGFCTICSCTSKANSEIKEVITEVHNTVTEAIAEIVEKDIKPEDIRLDKELLYDKHTLEDKGFDYENRNVRICFMGDRTVLEPKLQELMNKLERDSACKTGLTINIAINYGGRPEIVRAARSLAARAAAGELKPEDITEEALSAQMYTAGQKDPDFILRPSGEKRLSNFMLWQAAYSELVEMDVLWPDFTRDDLDAAIMEFNRRSRRFGGL